MGAWGDGGREVCLDGKDGCCSCAQALGSDHSMPPTMPTPMPSHHCPPARLALQCQKKWVMVEETKPKRERRPLPPVPPQLIEMDELPTDPQVRACSFSLFCLHHAAGGIRGLFVCWEHPMMVGAKWSGGLIWLR